MPKIINPEERKDPDLTVIYGALDAEDCIYLSLSFFRKEGSTMLPIVVQSLVAFIDEKYRLIDEKKWSESDLNQGERKDFTII